MCINNTNYIPIIINVIVFVNITNIMYICNSDNYSNVTIHIIYDINLNIHTNVIYIKHNNSTMFINNIIHTILNPNSHININMNMNVHINNITSININPTYVNNAFYNQR